MSKTSAEVQVRDTRRQFFAVVRGAIAGLDFTEILYADDTLLAVKNTRTANLYLKRIEEESAYYSMKLNKNKCNYICMNQNNKLKFADGTPLKSVDTAVYLGGTLDKQMKSITEINNRISSTMPILKSLNLNKI